MLLDVDWLVQSAFQVSGEPKDSCNFIRHFKTCGKPEKMRLDYDQCSNTKEHREVLVDVVISLLVQLYVIRIQNEKSAVPRYSSVHLKSQDS